MERGGGNGVCPNLLFIYFHVMLEYRHTGQIFDDAYTIRLDSNIKSIVNFYSSDFEKPLAEHSQGV